MTQQLEQAFKRASRLSEERQRAIAREMDAMLERAEREERVLDAMPEPKKRPTAHELGKHLAGIVEGPGDLSAFEAGQRWLGSVEGPEDLSTNKAYLDDLGASSLS